LPQFFTLLLLSLSQQHRPRARQQQAAATARQRQQARMGRGMRHAAVRPRRCAGMAKQRSQSSSLSHTSRQAASSMQLAAKMHGK